MQDRINEILNYTKEKLETITNSAECQNLRVEILGKSGKITGLFRFMKEVPNEEKGKVGAMLNNAKTDAEKLISAKEVFLEQAELEREINSAEVPIEADKEVHQKIQLMTIKKTSGAKTNNSKVITVKPKPEKAPEDNEILKNMMINKIKIDKKDDE